MTVSLTACSIITLITFHKVKDIDAVVADTSSGMSTSDSERIDEYVVAWKISMRRY
jgi:hypothetical protein